MSGSESTNLKVANAVRDMIRVAVDSECDYIDLTWFDGAMLGTFIKSSIKVGEHKFGRFDESDEAWKLIYWRIRWNNSPVGIWDATSFGCPEPIQVEQFGSDHLVVRLWLRPQKESRCNSAK